LIIDITTSFVQKDNLLTKPYIILIR